MGPDAFCARLDRHIKTKGEISRYRAQRKNLFWAKTPLNLDNIRSMDRIIAYKNINPEFVKILKQACIIRNSEKSWFRNIKEKLL